MLFTPALAECFGCPFCHISLLIFEFVSACRESQNVFIIWFYYKQHRPMLKNEVKKTTTRPPRPSARQTGPKWTTHSVSVKLCIKEILEYKQTANKPPPPPSTLQPLSVLSVRVSLFINSAVVAIAWLQTLLLNIGFLVLHVDKNKLCFCRTLGYSHPVFQSVFCECCLCLCVRVVAGGKRGEKWSGDIKGFDFI